MRQTAALVQWAITVLALAEAVAIPLQLARQQPVARAELQAVVAAAAVHHPLDLTLVLAVLAAQVLSVFMSGNWGKA